MSLYFLQHDPGLIERRLETRTEKDESQQIIRSFLMTALILMFVVAGVDHRLDWSDVPAPVVAIADAAVALGFVVIF